MIEFIRTSIKTSENTTNKLISILSVALVTMIILWFLQFLKNRKLKAKIKDLERNL
ncbi:hypothetical protein [Winogradskyella endarachnes]|uniref:Uncharacterized protein n=1 Tax=Winogradskyella endarachnes TaxID=2681965 RepID=A0A6L6U5T5_9FLAO|nr:hypothetical protein [Winogradskyella endarachnes]MUU77249.1 hypothetical protein [Winogradskyella endarachnes]